MTMCLVIVFLLSALLPPSLSHVRDPLAWLYGQQNQGYNFPASLQAASAGGGCPDECDCPPSFPVAMYCDGRGLIAMPTIPSHIKYLYLQNNAITAVPDSALLNATNLVWLMMHHNQLTSDAVGKQVFLKLEGLEHLYLQHNNLTRIPPNLPHSLRDLRINHNKIEKVTPTDLEGMDNLTVLYIHDNAVTDLGTSLKALTSLTLLDISGNKLTKVPDGLPEQLHQLYLESNSIDSLPEGFLGRFAQLQYIRMAHNQLTDKGIPPNTFNVTGLVELDLSFNKLERIPSVSTTLQHLYLQANQIKEFTLGSFCAVVDVSNFSKLRTLRLDGNEISRQDVPSESALCLRQASSIEDLHVDDEDENTERGNWANKKEYMLSMIGYAVGLGNIWRFPYLAYKNGGGAFLIPYFVMLVVAGIPLFFLESAFGQFCSQGPINIWRAVPLLQGVGIAMVMVTLIVSIYYNVIIAYSLYYMFASMQSPLPWSGCFSWADSNCSSTPIVYCNESGVLVANWTQENNTCSSSNRITVPVQSPSEQYWDHVALQRSSGLDETGPVVWHLALCLLLSSTLVGAALIRGIKSSGKVVYFTATFPYVVIVILLIRGVTLEGARDGIEFYIGSQSNMTKLMEAQVWKDAATQTFYSLSIGWGGVMTLASYNNFHNNVFKDAFVVTLTNAGTSVFAGFTIFSILGHMAYIYKIPVGEVVKEGFGLAFIAYPDALSTLPISPLWSILFFFMLLTVGLDSQFAGIEVLNTCLLDAFPKIFKSKHALLTIATSCILYLLGLPCVTEAGIYWVTLIDQFVASWVLLFLALLEIIGVSYIYGGNRFIKDIEMMLGNKTFAFWLWWRACWFFISPCVIVVILVWSLITFAPPIYGKVPYPTWGLTLGWCMVVFILIWIPVVALYKLIKAKGNPWKRLKSLCSPSEEWHPYLDVYRGERYSVERCRRRKNDKNKPEVHVNVITSSWL